MECIWQYLLLCGPNTRQCTQEENQHTPIHTHKYPWTYGHRLLHTYTDTMIVLKQHIRQTTCRITAARSATLLVTIFTLAGFLMTHLCCCLIEIEQVWYGHVLYTYKIHPWELKYMYLKSVQGSKALEVKNFDLRNKPSPCSLFKNLASTLNSSLFLATNLLSTSLYLPNTLVQLVISKCWDYLYSAHRAPPLQIPCHEPPEIKEKPPFFWPWCHDHRVKPKQERAFSNNIWPYFLYPNLKKDNCYLVAQWNTCFSSQNNLISTPLPHKQI